MARTIAISDLHLGARSQRCVLERPRVLESVEARLTDAGYDRLVLLGDTLELGEGRAVAEVMEIAVPVLEALGRVAPEVVLIPGNHDRLLIRDWLSARGDRLQLEDRVPSDASALLTETVAALQAGGAHVEVRYPGYALSDRVWMTHGHYIDRLLTPGGPYGLFRRPPRPTPAAYETRSILARKPSTIRITHTLISPRIAPLTSIGLDLQMRRQSLPALAAAVGALGVRSEFVIFGHVHRLGPLPRDRPGQWQRALAPGEAQTHFLNTGSWQHEEVLVGNGPRPSWRGRTGPHPYWPGGAVEIAEDGVPRAVNVLDGVDPGRGPASR